MLARANVNVGQGCRRFSWAWVTGTGALGHVALGASGEVGLGVFSRKGGPGAGGTTLAVLAFRKDGG